MGIETFKNQLKEMGFDPQERGNSCLSFSYTILCGKFQGTVIELGFCIPVQFPELPPSGPHINPHLLPIKVGGGSHPNDGVHLSGDRHGTAFTNEWQYWSRPFNGWSATERNVNAYLRHINHLMDTL